MRSWCQWAHLRLSAIVLYVFLCPSAFSAPLVRDFPNGLRTAVVEDGRIPLVAIDVCFLVGEADDPLDWPGLARLIGGLWEQSPTRHLAAGGTGKLLESAGLLARNPKVVVYRDRTHVTFVVPAHATELVLWMAAERLAFLSDGVDALEVRSAALRLKKDLDERAGRVLENLDEIGRRAAFGPSHPYGFGLATASLGNVAPELVRARLRSLYTAGNAYVTVLGNVPPGTDRLLERYFAGLAGTKVEPISATKPARVASELNVAADVRYRAEELEWPSAPYTTRDDVSLDVLAQWLMARLEERLVRHERLAVSVFARQHSSRLQSLFRVRLTLADGAPADKAVAAVEEELAAVRAGRVDAAELSFAKEHMLVNLVLADDGVLSRAQTRNVFRAYTGDVDGFDRYFAMYGATTPADLTSAVARNLEANARVLVHVEPSVSAPKAGVVASPLPAPRFRRPAAPAPAPTADASPWYRPPATSSAQSFSPDTPVVRILPDGTRVVVAQRDLGPIVRVRVSLPLTGVPPSPEAEWLVSRLLYGADVEGQPLQARLSRLGASLKVDQTFDLLTLDVNVARRGLGEAVRVVLGALGAAKFSEEGFQQLKTEHLKGLSKPRSEPSHRIWDTVTRRLYVGAHRYHRDSETAERDLKALDRSGLERYLRGQVARAPLAVSFIGDMDADAAESVVKATRKNAASGPPRAIPKRPAPQVVAGAQLEEDAAAKETSVVVLCPAAGFGESDFAASGGLRWVLGGPFAPKIADRFAAEKVHLNRAVTNLLVRQGEAFVFAEVSVPSAQAAGAVRAILDQFAILAANGPGAEGLAQARREAMDFVISWYDSIESHSSLLDAVGTGRADVTAPIFAYRRAQGLSAADVQGVAKRCAATLRVVAVGQVKEIAAELEKRKVGPVAIHPAPEAR